MITLRNERTGDALAREALLDEVFGDIRYRKTSERLREGRLPADGLSFIVAEGKRVVGTARLWNIDCGEGQPALLLGPVAVAADNRNRGIGGALVRHAVQTARRRGYGAIILVGDAPYYGRFGFTAAKTGALRLPGPFERHRLLALELKSGALDGARGMIAATGRMESQPDLAAPVAPDRRTVRARRPRQAA
jgi:predicted N-acetyltransferase YhbS